MKLIGLKDEIVIDYFPNPYQSKQKIFFTTVTYLEEIKLPAIIPKIYTSHTLMKQFIGFFKSKGITIKEDNFFILKHFEVHKIMLTDGTGIEVFCGEPQNITTNLFLVFRKGTRITHVYAGICLDLGNVLENAVLPIWLKSCDFCIDNLYITQYSGCERCVDCELEKALQNINEQMIDRNKAKLWLRFPPTGCEYLISCLATEFCKRIAICGLLRELYENVPNVEMNLFTTDLNKAIIILSDEDLSLDLQCQFGAPTENYLIKWSPLPAFFELNLLANLVRPKNIINISHKYAISHVPIHFTKFSRNGNLSKQVTTVNTQNDQTISEQKKETPPTTNTPQDKQYPSTSGLQKNNTSKELSTKPNLSGQLKCSKQRNISSVCFRQGKKGMVYAESSSSD